MGFTEEEIAVQGQDPRREMERVRARCDGIDRLDTLAEDPYEAIDTDAVRDGLAALADLPGLLPLGSLEERKRLARPFLAGVTVYPDANRLDLWVRRIPSMVVGNSSVGVVAAARCEPVQIALDPPERLLAGGRRCAA